MSTREYIPEGWAAWYLESLKRPRKGWRTEAGDASRKRVLEAWEANPGASLRVIAKAAGLGHAWTGDILAAEGLRPRRPRGGPASARFRER